MGQGKLQNGQGRAARAMQEEGKAGQQSRKRASQARQPAKQKGSQGKQASKAQAATVLPPIHPQLLVLKLRLKGITAQGQSGAMRSRAQFVNRYLHKIETKCGLCEW